MEMLVKPDRFVYNESLNNVIAYHDEDDTPLICTVGQVLGVAAIIAGAGFTIVASGGTAAGAAWWFAYATTSALFAVMIDMGC